MYWPILCLLQTRYASVHVIYGYNSACIIYTYLYNYPSDTDLTRVDGVCGLSDRVSDVQSRVSAVSLTANQI